MSPRSFYQFILFYFFSFTLASAADWTKSSDWNKWLDQYASPAPLMSINKAYGPSLRVTDDQLKNLFARKTRIQLNHPVQIEGKNVLEFDVFEEIDARRFNTFDQVDSRVLFGTNAIEALNEETRFNQIQSEVYSLIGSRKEDELLVLQMGATHALDIYFGYFLQDKDKIKKNPALQRRNEILYVAYPVQEETSFNSQNYYDILSIIDGVAPPLKKVSDSFAASSTYFLSRLQYFLDLNREAISLAKIKEEKLSKMGTLIFMDWHHINANEAYKKMPHAKALRELGFKSVRVGLEGLEAKRDYPLETLKRFFLTPAALKLRDFEIEFLKKKAPELAKKYQAGLSVCPIASALYDTLKDYEANKIQVTLTGIDAFDIFKEESANPK